MSLWRVWLLWHVWFLRLIFVSSLRLHWIFRLSIHCKRGEQDNTQFEICKDLFCLSWSMSWPGRHNFAAIIHKIWLCRSLYQLQCSIHYIKPPLSKWIQIVMLRNFMSCFYLFSIAQGRKSESSYTQGSWVCNSAI